MNDKNLTHLDHCLALLIACAVFTIVICIKHRGIPLAIIGAIATGFFCFELVETVYKMNTKEDERHDSNLRHPSC